MDVTVVHVMPTLMERQLDEVAGGLLQKSLEDRGLHFWMGAQTHELVGGDDGRVKAVRFQDGNEVPAELVVMEELDERQPRFDGVAIEQGRGKVGGKQSSARRGDAARVSTSNAQSSSIRSLKRRVPVSANWMTSVVLNTRTPGSRRGTPSPCR